LKEQFYKIVTVLAIIAYFVPMAIVLLKKLWKDVFFLLFAVYWIVGAIINIISFIPGITPTSLEIVTVLYNMFDIPFILAILWYTTTSISLKKLLKIVIGSYVVVELLLVMNSGVRYDSIKYILGAGVLMVLVTLVWEITLYLQRMEHTNREKSMLFIYAALLFEYGTYTIVYTFEYFILAYDVTDNLLIYYISTVIAILIASVGFLLKKNPEPLFIK
jgi:hypothetical protein